MNIAIITGEASGDRVGGQLAEELRRLRPDVTLWGTGGRHMKAAGVEIIVDSSRWGVVGLVSGLQVMPRVLKARGFLHQELLRRRPDVLVPVDAGAFNIGFPGVEGLCPWARKHLPDTKILYYFPPGSWRRTLKSTPLANLTDRVVTPFPWSEIELRRLGVNANFFGHPLLDIVHPTKSREAFAAEYGIDLARPVVGLLPGSRPQEISAILPTQLEAARIIYKRVPSAQFLLALAATVDRESVVRAIEQAEREQPDVESRERSLQELSREEPVTGTVPVVEGGRPGISPQELEEQRKKWLQRAADIPQTTDSRLPIAIVEDATYDVMVASDVLLITSGTATLEAAILGRPMVIVYKMSSANRIEYAFVKKGIPEHIGMPNLLAQKRICPEYIQEAATPEALANEIISLLLEPDRMLRMRQDLQTAIAQLGEPGGAARTARMVLEMIGK